MYAEGCVLVPLSEAAEYLPRKFRQNRRTKAAYETWEKMLGKSANDMDFDAYVLDAAARAEIWLLIHRSRRDIFGGFELTTEKEKNPIKFLALYWYYGYTQSWEANMLVFEQLTRRLEARGAPAPTNLFWSQIRLFWQPQGATYDPHLQIPQSFTKRLVLKNDVRRQAA